VGRIAQVTPGVLLSELLEPDAPAGRSARQAASCISSLTSAAVASLYERRTLLLLETRSLVTFSLLFGTTWLVNALTFFAILASVLLAIFVNARRPIRRPALLYAALFGALALAYLLPPEALLIDPPWLRYLVVSTITFGPVFIANLVSPSRSGTRPQRTPRSPRTSSALCSVAALTTWHRHGLPRVAARRARPVRPGCDIRDEGATPGRSRPENRDLT
jgi:hypothetical protein